MKSPVEEKGRRERHTIETREAKAGETGLKRRGTGEIAAGRKESGKSGARERENKRRGPIYAKTQERIGRWQSIERAGRIAEKAVLFLWAFRVFSREHGRTMHGQMHIYMSYKGGNQR